MAQAVTIPTPPRATGVSAIDTAAALNWLWVFYEATIVSGGLLQPSELEAQLEGEFPTLHALGVLAGTQADRLAYFTGPNRLALATLTAFARSILDDTNAAAFIATLGLGALALLNSVGTSQIDADAVTFARMQNLAANSLVGSVAGGDPAEIPCTAAGRALLDDPDASAQRATLGLSSTVNGVHNIDGAAPGTVDTITIANGLITGITIRP